MPWCTSRDFSFTLVAKLRVAATLNAGKQQTASEPRTPRGPMVMDVSFLSCILQQFYKCFCRQFSLMLLREIQCCHAIPGILDCEVCLCIDETLRHLQQRFETVHCN
mmetsp:Transcript_134656/g.288125  ORF Transcript_134656/g.288125 Transcript_134656/m.288125 type:complete len:107 (+) Transcript_134656:197-517(+)